jgi:hypothetical protein
MEELKKQIKENLFKMDMVLSNDQSELVWLNYQTLKMFHEFCDLVEPRQFPKPEDLK